MTGQIIMLFSRKLTVDQPFERGKVQEGKYKDILEWFYVTCEIGSRILRTIMH